MVYGGGWYGMVWWYGMGTTTMDDGQRSIHWMRREINLAAFFKPFSIKSAKFRRLAQIILSKKQDKRIFQ